MRRLCIVEANLDDMSRGVKKKKSPNGEYWQLALHIIVKFGATSMRAWMEWEEEVLFITLDALLWCLNISEIGFNS
jgi:hypothetical protein